MLRAHKHNLTREMTVKQMTVKRAMRQVMMMVCGLGVVLGAQAAVAGDAPALLPDGEYQCQVDSGYRFRKCAVSTEEGKQVLSFTEEGHLLMLKGVIYPPYDKKLKHVFAEVALTGEKPYICGVKDAAAQAECKAQKPVITFKKRGRFWVGTMVVKHYMDQWSGEGEARAVSGYMIQAETLKVTLKK